MKKKQAKKIGPKEIKELKKIQEIARKEKMERERYEDLVLEAEVSLTRALFKDYYKNIPSLEYYVLGLCDEQNRELEASGHPPMARYLNEFVLAIHADYKTLNRRLDQFKIKNRIQKSAFK